MAFAGTTQKCMACDKTVYLVDKLTADNRIYHKACFRCHHCNGTLKLSNYNSFEGVLYCRPHFDQLFKTTGSLDKSFEGIAASNQRTTTTNKHARPPPQRYRASTGSPLIRCCPSQLTLDLEPTTVFDWAGAPQPWTRLVEGLGTPHALNRLPLRSNPGFSKWNFIPQKLLQM
ncbi:hypothetical protein OSB04_005512 [Centaurea solstitialis]|uniref:LIM zinc-binding domain-containing protein n=1 Tax=Centaurea solstitialis TaxID=347529 RepID=A0AA38TZB2_9ASTR|nr:hypothetical protein OSB04_005512 [Centaurea solstitialis]